MISLEKLKILIPLQKLPKNVGDLSKLIVSKGFEKLPKVQLIAQSGHTAADQINGFLNAIATFITSPFSSLTSFNRKSC